MHSVQPTCSGPRERGVALVATVFVVLVSSMLVTAFMTVNAGGRAVMPGARAARSPLDAAQAGVRTVEQHLTDMAQSKYDSCVAKWNFSGGSGPGIIADPSALFPPGTISFHASNHPSYSATGSLVFSADSITPSRQSYSYTYTVQSTGTMAATGTRRVYAQGVIRVSARRGSFADYPMFASARQVADDIRESLPAGTRSQAAAALGLGGAPALGNREINEALGAGGEGAPASGIYVPHSGTAVTGGVYVQGDLSQCLLWADAAPGRQYLRLAQGAVVRTILVDRAAGTTTVWNNAGMTGTPAVYSGTLPGGVVHVEGAIRDLRGPDRNGLVVPPAIARGTHLMLSATRDIVIQRDITLDAYSRCENVLGIQSGQGGVRIGHGAPADLHLDAFVMAAGLAAPSAGGSPSPGRFCVDSWGTGAARGALHLRGSVITRYDGNLGTYVDGRSATVSGEANGAGAAATGYARDFQYDRRGLKPPAFPETNRFVPASPSAQTRAWRES